MTLALRIDTSYILYCEKDIRISSNIYKTMDVVSTIFQGLPQDLLHMILSYNGTIKYRNGMYMNQLSNDDAIYSRLLSIKQPIYHTYTTRHSHSTIPITIDNHRVSYSYSACIPYFYKNGDRNYSFAKLVDMEHDTVSYSIYDTSNAINKYYFERT